MSKKIIHYLTQIGLNSYYLYVQYIYASLPYSNSFSSANLKHHAHVSQQCLQVYGFIRNFTEIHELLRTKMPNYGFESIEPHPFHACGVVYSRPWTYGKGLKNTLVYSTKRLGERLEALQSVLRPSALYIGPSSSTYHHLLHASDFSPTHQLPIPTCS